MVTHAPVSRDSTSMITNLNPLFTQLNGLMELGGSRTLEQSDLGTLPSESKIKLLSEKFQLAWAKELLLPKEKRSLRRSVTATVGVWRPVLAIVLSGIGAGSGFAGPLLMKAISRSQAGIEVLSPTSLWIFVALTFVFPVLGVICTSLAQAHFVMISVQIRNVVTAAIFDKVLVLRSTSIETGAIMNMFNVDIRQIEMAVGLLSGVIFFPAQIAVALALIYQQVGVSMFVGFAMVVAVFPLTMSSQIMFIKFYMQRLKLSDKRIKLTNEILSGVRVIKYYAWEEAFMSSISGIRVAELAATLNCGYFWAIMQLFLAALPVVLPIIVFYTYIKLGNQLDYVTAFTTLTLFGLLKAPIGYLPNVLQACGMAQVSSHRILRFFNEDSIIDYINHDQATFGDSANSDVPVVVKFEAASLGWSLVSTSDKPDAAAPKDAAAVASSTDRPPAEGDVEMATTITPDDSTKDATNTTNRAVHTLLDLNLTVRRGQLVGVVGAVGSGKSSLLSALLCELHLRSGQVHMTGSLAYHQQTPWILNSTIKDNIIFGLEFDDEKFKNVLVASALEADLATLPAGIDTEIGEKGINLSGGQKARVSFARALYRNADVYLLDDPLSAVDAHVGNTMFHNGIKQYLSGKTVILATHQVHFLKECDQVVVLEAGRITANGTYEELNRSGIDLEAIVPQVVEGEKVMDEVEEEEDPDGVSAEELAAAPGAAGESLSDSSPRRLRSRTRTRTSSSDGGHVRSKSITKKPEEVVKPKTTGDLMTEEEKDKGSVDNSVYWYFIMAGGPIFYLLSTIISLGGNASSIAGNEWLTTWGDAVMTSYIHNGRPLTGEENLAYIGKYAWLSIILAVATSLRALLCCIHTVRAGKVVHERILTRIMNAPVSFFDTTPQGRIMNRFSNDQMKVDIGIGPIGSMAIGAFADALGCIGALAYTTHGTFLVLLAPLGVMYYYIQAFFRKSNIALQRLDSVAKSPIISQFTQTLGGTASIRAFKCEADFVGKLHASVEAESLCYLLQQWVGGWLSVRLDSMGALIVLFVYILTILKPNFIPPGQLLVAITYALQLPALCNMIVQVSALVEVNMNSMERMKYYISTVDQEENIHSDESVEVPDNWPSEGKIAGEDLVMGYRDGPDVLHKLSFSTNAREKVGIVGRTGSGKSSMMVALFRIEKLRAGRLSIDGIDVAKVPIKVLRSRLGIIPQDPVLWAATVRFNLDPFDQVDDIRLWEVLETVNMASAVADLPLKLLEPVAEGGSNFSLGQRQLLCFARALLRSPKVLVLDEATASVDNTTDAQIQAMIRDKFTGCTVLTIAHRLHTIIDSDRIMVLDKGALVEMGSSQELIANESGVFAQLWKQFQQSHKE